MCLPLLSSLRWCSRACFAKPSTLETRILYLKKKSKTLHTVSSPFSQIAVRSRVDERFKKISALRPRKEWREMYTSLSLLTFFEVFLHLSCEFPNSRLANRLSVFFFADVRRAVILPGRFQGIVSSIDTSKKSTNDFCTEYMYWNHHIMCVIICKNRCKKR